MCSPVFLSSSSSSWNCYTYLELCECIDSDWIFSVWRINHWPSLCLENEGPISARASIMYSIRSSSSWLCGILISQMIFALRRTSCSTLITLTLIGIDGNVNVEMRFKFSAITHDRLQLFIQQHFNADEHLCMKRHLKCIKKKIILFPVLQRFHVHHHHL